MNKAIFTKKIGMTSHKEEFEEFMEDVWNMHPYLIEVTDDDIKFSIPSSEYKNYSGIYIVYSPNGESSIFASKETGRESAPNLLIGKYNDISDFRQLLAKGSITKDYCPMCGKYISFEKQEPFDAIMDADRGFSHMRYMTLRGCPDCIKANADDIMFKSGW